MDHSRIRSLIVTVSLACFSLVMISPVVSSAQQANTANQPAIEVDNKSISQQKYNQTVQNQLQRIKQRMKQSKPQKQPPMNRMRSRVKKQVRQNMVNKLVLESHVEQSDVTVTQEKIDQEWQKLVKKVGSEQKVKQRLKKMGKTPKTVRQDIKKSLKTRKFIDENTPESTVSEEQLRKQYQRQKKRLGDRSFEEVKPMLRQQLEQRKQKKQVQQLVKKLKQKSNINVNV